MFFLLRCFFFTSLCTIFYGCNSIGYCYPRYGLEELVTDSYMVRQGKASVMELQGKEFEDLDEEYFKEYCDTISDGDSFTIVFYHPTRLDLSQKFDLIDKKIGFRVIDGKLDLPNIKPIYVQGLTLSEAKIAIQTAYASWLDNVEIFLEYRHRPIHKVDIIGKVNQRQLPVNGKLRLFEALSIAGLSPNISFFESYVIRNGKMLPIDLEKLIVEGDERYNIVLKASDKIFLADCKESRASVMGEVYRPTTVSLPFGTFPLRDALVEAGGIAPTANRNSILLIRSSSYCPKIYALSWDEIACMPPTSLLLIAGDLVYVEEKAIAAWNRFLSQILPTFSLFERSHGCYRCIY